MANVSYKDIVNSVMGGLKPATKAVTNSLNTAIASKRGAGNPYALSRNLIMGENGKWAGGSPNWKTDNPTSRGPALNPYGLSRNIILGKDNKFHSAGEVYNLSDFGKENAHEIASTRQGLGGSEWLWDGYDIPKYGGDEDDGKGGNTPQGVVDNALNGDSENKSPYEDPEDSIYDVDNFGNTNYTLSGEKVTSQSDIDKARMLDKHQDWGFGDDFGRFQAESTKDQFWNVMSDPEFKKYYQYIYDDKRFWDDENDPNSFNYDKYWEFTRGLNPLAYAYQSVENAATNAALSSVPFEDYQFIYGGNDSAGAAHSLDTYLANHPEDYRFLVNGDTFDFEDYMSGLGYDPTNQESIDAFTQSAEGQALLNSMVTDNNGTYLKFDPAKMAEMYDAMNAQTRVMLGDPYGYEDSGLLLNLGGITDWMIGRADDRPDLTYNSVKLDDGVDYSGYNPWYLTDAGDLSGYVNDDNSSWDKLLQMYSWRNPEYGKLTRNKK